MKKWLVAVIVVIIAITVFANLGDEGEIPRETNSESSSTTENGKSQSAQTKADEFYWGIRCQNQ